MALIDGAMNACGYSKILADMMTPSLQKTGRKGIFQHDNDPKKTANIILKFSFLIYFWGLLAFIEIG